MKKLSVVDVVGTILVFGSVAAMIILFAFHSNGQYVANLVIR